MKASLVLCTASVLFFVGCGTGTMAVAPEWESMKGPRAQDVTALLLSGGPASAPFAGTQEGRVYTASAPGAVWTRISTIREGAAIHGFVRNPEKPARLYAATDAGLFVSANEGASWAEILLMAGETTPVGSRTLAIDPWNTSVMYAGTKNKGIRKSSDGGETWNPANEGIPGLDSADVREILIDLSRPDRILAAVSPMGVVQSSDAGKNWSRLTEEFTSSGSAVTHLVQNGQAPAAIVYGTNAGSIRRSTDGGTTWSPSRNGSAEGTILSLSTIPGRPDALLAGTESGILFSSDFGASWTNITGSLPHIPVAAVPAPDGRALYAFGEGIGLQRTADSGATWTHVDANLGGAVVRLVTTDEKGERLYAALGHAVLAFDSSTSSWRSASSGLPGGTITSLVVDSDSPLHLFAATSLGGFQSSNGGESWELVTRNLRITPRILEPHPRIRTRMLAAGTLGLDISTDKGSTWQQTKPFSARYQISAFTFVPANTGIIYGATMHAAVITKDGGFLWESSRYGLHDENVVAITLDDREPAIVYAWTSRGGGYRSLDAGLEWNSYTPPWKQTDTVLIAYDRYQPSSVVALVNDRDIYFSRSGGGTWVSLAPAKLKGQAQSLWWNAAKATLYVGTKADGVQRIALGMSLNELLGEQE